MPFFKQNNFWFEPKSLPILLVLPLWLLLFEGCRGSVFNYYKVAASTSDGEQVEGAIAREKYIIVHNNNDVWHLKNPEINKSTDELTGTRTELPSNHLFYLKVEARKNLKYNQSEGHPENEVHIYLTEYAIDDRNNVVISLQSINRLDVYDKSIGKNILSYFVVYVGGYFTIFIIASLIALLLY